VVPTQDKIVIAHSQFQSSVLRKHRLNYLK
jgi:hypothetical protein